MPSIDIAKLVQQSTTKFATYEPKQEEEPKEELQFEGVLDSLGKTYRAVTGQQTAMDHVHNAVGSASKAINAGATNLGNKIASGASTVGNKISSGVSTVGRKVSSLASDHPAAAGGIAAGATALGIGLAARRAMKKK